MKMVENEDKKIEEVLKNQNLFNLITETEFNKTIVGEYKTRKAVFLDGCKIWVKDEPSNLLVGGESSIGKDFVMKNVIKIFPKDKRIDRTRISPKAFTYWHKGEKNWTWTGKILCLTDISEDVLNNDVFKVMCSDGNQATIVINQKAVDINIEGKPIMIVTTANSNPTNEILNRFDLISLDESKEQTENIMKFQAKELETGFTETYSKEIISALDKLKRIAVIIPFASKMNKYFPKITKMRRMFKRFSGYIKSSCALYQYQREQDNKGRFIANKQDYEIAREVIENIREQTITGKTAREGKYLEIFENLIKNNTEKWFSVAEIHNKTKYKSLETWWDIMKKLEEKDLIEGKEFEGMFKPIRKFTIKEKTSEEQLKLPKFEDLE